MKKQEKKFKTQFQHEFVHRWNNQNPKKEYNALEDPYASSYFKSKSVRKHIKSMKKAIEVSQNRTHKPIFMKQPTSQPKKHKLPKVTLTPSNVLKSIDISDHDIVINLTQTAKSLFANRTIKHKKNKKLLFFSIHQVSRYENLQHQMGKSSESCYSGLFSNYSKKAVEMSNRLKHNNFIEFLNNKKLEVAKSTEKTNTQQINEHHSSQNPPNN